MYVYQNFLYKRDGIMDKQWPWMTRTMAQNKTRNCLRWLQNKFQNLNAKVNQEYCCQADVQTDGHTDRKHQSIGQNCFATHMIQPMNMFIFHYTMFKKMKITTTWLKLYLHDLHLVNQLTSFSEPLGVCVSVHWEQSTLGVSGTTLEPSLASQLGNAHGTYRQSIR